jgi:hypothetical protein
MLGYITASQENAWLKQINAAPTAVFLDPYDKLGHLHDAKTTPDMFVMNPLGILIYQGAIDDHESTDPSDIKRSKGYVSAALNKRWPVSPLPLRCRDPAAAR